MSFSRATAALLKSVNAVFGTTAVYTYSDGSAASTIKGVFDNAYVEINMVSTKKPVFKVNLVDLTSTPTEGDSLLIGSTNYSVRDHEPDSFGSTILILEKN